MVQWRNIKLFLIIQTFNGVQQNIWLFQPWSSRNCAFHVVHLLLFRSQFGFSQSLDFLVTLFLKAWQIPPVKVLFEAYLDIHIGVS